MAAGRLWLVAQFPAPLRGYPLRTENDQVGTAEEAASVSAAIEGELRLMDPAVRSSRAEVMRLLDPEFTEVGASGRRYMYETRFDGRRALRSSLWRKHDDRTGWRMYYHQGTPIP